MFGRKKKKLAADDYLGEFLQMIEKPRYPLFTGPSVIVEGPEGTFGSRIDRRPDGGS